MIIITIIIIMIITIVITYYESARGYVATGWGEHAAIIVISTGVIVISSISCISCMIVCR